MGCNSLEATKAFLIRAVRATLAARLMRWAGLRFAGFFFAVFVWLAVFGLEAEEPEGLAPGATVDCGAAGMASISNESRTTIQPEAGRATRIGEEMALISLL